MERASRLVAQKTLLISCSKNTSCVRKPLYLSFSTAGNSYLHPYRWHTCGNHLRPREEITTSTLLHPLNNSPRLIRPRWHYSSCKHLKEFSHNSYYCQGKSVVKMSDESYMKFLEGANKVDICAEASSKPKLKNLDHDVDIPDVLQEATNEAYYTSESDEPFLPVVLRVENGLPDATSFAKLVHHPNPEDADVQILEVFEWDRYGQYGEIVDAVKAAVLDSTLHVFRIEITNAMSEYWIVGIRDSFLLGVKALSIES